MIPLMFWGGGRYRTEVSDWWIPWNAWARGRTRTYLTFQAPPMAWFEPCCRIPRSLP